MSDIEEVCKLAHNTLLPAFELVEDHSPLHYDPSRAKQATNSICLVRSKLEKCQFSCDPSVRDSEVSSLLLLCGENISKAEWNTEHAVIEATNLLSVICQKCGVKDVKDLMVGRQVSKLMEVIRPKLGKNCFKKFPATIQCFVWLLKNTKHPHVDEIINQALPISLVLVDDYETNNQRMGLQVIHHILIEASTSALQHLGWASVISDALKPSHFRELVEILEVYACLNLCLKVMCSNPTNPSTWNETDHYDTTFNQLLWNIEMEQSDEAKYQYLVILMDYVNSMKIRSLRFLPVVCKILDTYVTADSNLKLCTKSLEVLNQLLRLCWPCKGLDCMQDILWIIFKAHHRGVTSSKSEHAAEIRKLVEKCAQSIELVSQADSATLRVMMETVK